MQVVLCWIILLLNGGVCARRLNDPKSLQTDDNQEIFHVMVGTKDGNAPILLDKWKKPKRSFKRTKSVSTVVTKKELLELQEDSNVLDIEEDALVFPDAEDVSLYSMKMIGAAKVLGTPTSRAACNDPESFKIGIVDSGLAVDHPDIPCLPIDYENTNCFGTEINLKDKDGLWHNPVKRNHGALRGCHYALKSDEPHLRAGTHVAGVIGASGRNNFGIEGVIGDGNFCFLIARVFGESGTGSRMSDIFEAVEWLVDQGANIINMSLGSGVDSKQGSEIMRAAYEEGVLLIASSGNDGTKDEHYPANFDNVLSVAAVKEDLSKANFSQYNSGVDIAAPGVEILSTYPLGLGEALFLTGSKAGAIGRFMVHSKSPASISGLLTDCPNYGVDSCPGSGNHICLIERGQIKFEAKALSCEASGGVAAIIYNNAPGLISGSLANPSSVTIPVIEIRQVAGHQLRDTSLNEELIIELKSGYGFKSGTSMAAPHVTGVAAKVWRECPACTNTDVETCLMNTAIDLGEEGKDIHFGWGLIQADAAYSCLVNVTKCCTNVTDIGRIGIEEVPLPNQILIEPSNIIEPSDRPSRVPQSWVSADAMLQSMATLESLSELAEDPTQVSEKLTTIVTEDVEFNLYFKPNEETLAKIYLSRTGIPSLIESFVVTALEGPEPLDVTFGEDFVQYRRQYRGSMESNGPEVAVESLTTLRFNDGGLISSVQLEVFGTGISSDATAKTQLLN